MIHIVCEYSHDRKKMLPDPVSKSYVCLDCGTRVGAERVDVAVVDWQSDPLVQRNLDFEPIVVFGRIKTTVEYHRPSHGEYQA